MLLIYKYKPSDKNLKEKEWSSDVFEVFNTSEIKNLAILYDEIESLYFDLRSKASEPIVEDYYFKDEKITIRLCDPGRILITDSHDNEYFYSHKEYTFTINNRRLNIYDIDHYNDEF